MFVRSIRQTRSQEGMQLGDLEYVRSMMPNMHVVHRDKAHAARRLSSRGWSADAYLHSVLWV